MRIMLLGEAVRCPLLSGRRVRTDVLLKNLDGDWANALEDVFEIKKKGEVGLLVLRHQLVSTRMISPTD